MVLTVCVAVMGLVLPCRDLALSCKNGFYTTGLVRSGYPLFITGTIFGRFYFSGNFYIAYFFIVSDSNLTQTLILNLKLSPIDPKP